MQPVEVRERACVVNALTCSDRSRLMDGGAVRRMTSGPQADEAVTSPNGGPMIQLEGVRKSFGDNLVLDGIDLSVAHGEVLVVIGPSGSGKRTPPRCRNRLHP